MSDRMTMPRPHKYCHPWPAAAIRRAKRLRNTQQRSPGARIGVVGPHASVHDVARRRVATVQKMSIPTRRDKE